MANYKIIQKIANFKFTNRECDIIACVINNRGEKKIAEILGISPNTVNTHVSNILSKIGASSKEHIIDLIYKSNLYKNYQTHYNYLYKESTFISSITYIGRIIKNKNITYVFGEDLNFRNPKYSRIISYLKIANISLHHHKNELTQFVIYLDKKKYDEDIKNTNKTLLNLDNQIEIDYLKVLDLILELSNNNSEIKKIRQKFIEEYKNVDTNNSNIASNSITKKVASEYQGYWILILYISLFSFFTIMWNYLPSLNPKNTVTWNLPKIANHNIERQKIIKQLQDKIKNCDNQKNTNCYIGLSGLGGIGKTTLAKNIATSQKGKYDFIGWFQAEKKELIENQYFELGSYYNLFHDNMSKFQKILAVKEWVKQFQNSLIIYDNIEDIEDIKDFIPDNSTIILTSISRNLPEFIEVDQMSDEESVKLLIKVLGNTDYSIEENYKNSLTSLANVLGNLPLALAQAGAYIKKNKMTIEEYILLFQNQHKLLLEDASLPVLDSHIPAYTSWDISMEKIKSQPTGNIAIELLDIMSYFNNEKIPKSLLLEIIHSEDKNLSTIDFNKARDLLEKYSLISSDIDNISIHKLTSSWIRSKHSKDIRNKILQKCFKIVKLSGLPFQKDVHGSDINFINRILPQIQTLISYLDPIEYKLQLAELKTILGYIYFELNDYKKAKLELQNSLDLKKSLSSIQKRNLLDTLSLLAITSYLLGDINLAKSLADEAAIFANQINVPDQSCIYAFRTCGVIFYAIGEYKKGGLLLEKALLTSHNLKDKYPLSHARNLRECGRYHEFIGDPKKSTEYLKESLSIQQKYLRNNHIDISYTLGILGNTEILLEEYSDGIRDLERAYKIQIENIKSNNVEKAFITRLLGRAYYKSGNIAKGRKFLQESLNMLENYYDNDNVMIASTLSDLGILENISGNHDLSIKHLEKAILVRQNYFPRNNMRVANLIRNLGITYISSGKYDQGISLLEEAKETFIRNLGFENIKVADIIYHIGLGYKSKSEYIKSLEYFDSAFKIQSSYFGVSDKKLLPILNQKADIYKMLGNRENLNKINLTISKI